MISVRSFILLILWLFASWAGAQDCLLGVKPGQFTALQQRGLVAKGYRVTVSRDLDFDGFKLGLYVPSVFPYALDASEGAYKIYYQQDDITDVHPIMMMMSTKFADLFTCAKLKSAIHYQIDLRNSAGLALQFQGGQGSQVRQGEAMLYAERTYFKLQGEELDWPKVLSSYRGLLGQASVAVEAKLKVLGKTRDQLSYDEFLDVLNEVRVVAFNYGLKNYCKTQASMSHFLIERCANCSGQTKIILSLDYDLNLRAPAGWNFGAELYEDHVRPVLFSLTPAKVVDLVYNAENDGLENPILSPVGVLRKEIENFLRLRPSLRFSWEPYSLVNSQVYAHYIYTSVWDRISDTIGLAHEPDISAAPAPVYFRESAVFDGPTFHRFRQEEPPDHADLTYAIDAKYHQESRDPKLEVKVDKPDPRNFDPLLMHISSNQFSPASLETLTPQDRENYKRIMATQAPTADDYVKYTYRNIIGLKICEQSQVDEKLLPPLEIEYLPKDTARFGDASFRLSQYADGPALRYVYTVFDSAEAERLKTLSQSDRYNDLFGKLQRELRLSITTRIPLIEGFLSSDNPFALWHLHGQEIAAAYIAMTLLTDDVSEIEGPVSCLTPNLADVDSGYDAVKYRVEHGHFVFAKKILSDTRSLILAMDQLPQSEIVSLIDFIYLLQRQSIGDLDPTEKSQLDADRKLYSVYYSPIQSLLSHMLKDPDVLFTSKMSETESALFKSKFQLEAEPRLGPEIHLPVLPGHVNCLAQGGLVQSLGFYVECPSPKISAGGAGVTVLHREVREINPVILVKLMVVGSTAIFDPSIALMIANAWRSAHDAAFAQLYPGAKALRAHLMAKAVDLFGKNKNGPTMVDIDNIYHDELRVLRLWEFIDGILAVNLPTYQMAWYNYGTPDDFNLHFAQPALKYLSDHAGDTVPAWVSGNSLYEEAYSLYSTLRPQTSHQVIRLATMSANLPPYGPLAQVSGEDQLVWDPDGWAGTNAEYYTGSSKGTFLCHRDTLDSDLWMGFDENLQKIGTTFYWSPGYTIHDPQIENRSFEESLSNVQQP